MKIMVYTCVYERQNYHKNYIVIQVEYYLQLNEYCMQHRAMVSSRTTTIVVMPVRTPIKRRTS